MAQDGALHVSIVWMTVLCGSFIITAPGTGALKVIGDPPKNNILVGHFGLNAQFNCTTDDPNATVVLLHSSQFGQALSERALAPNKVIVKEQVFTVLNLIISDAGQYNCKATDQSLNTTQWPANVLLVVGEVSLPSHFVLIPNRGIVIVQGQTASVTCESGGASVVTLKWEKQTGPTFVSVDESWITTIKDPSTNRIRATLQITNAKLADSANYRCTVTVKHKSTSWSINIRINARTAPTIEAYPGETDIIEGEEHNLTCEAKGSPKPDVAWYRKGQKLNDTHCKKDPNSCSDIAYEIYEDKDSPIHTVWTYGVLRIRSAVYPRDQGEFKCVASNGNLPSPELNINLNVRVAPQISKEPADKVKFESEDTETQVPCIVAKSNPLATFKWLYQSVDCPVSSQGCNPADEKKWKPVPSRLITPAAGPANRSVVKVESDRGSSHYKCQAYNSWGNDSLVITLRRVVKAKPMIEVDTVKTETEYNERSSLKVFCIEGCFGLCGNVYFTKDGKRLSAAEDSRVNITFEQQDRIVLTVTNATVNDSGNYRCWVEYPSISWGINITVKELGSPTITGLHDQTVLQEENGKQVLLKCNATGNSLPTITWHFYQNGNGPGRKVTASDLGGNIRNCKDRLPGFYFLREKDHSQLVICRPDYEKHQGKYSCDAKNEVGSVSMFAVVNVEMAPRIIEPSEGFSPPLLNIDETLNVTCKAKGNPSPTVRWRKNSTGQTVGTSQKISNQLLIKSLKEEDFGIYECIASNKFKSAVVRVHVKKGPGASPNAGDGRLSTGALVGIVIGVGVFVIVVLVVCICLYRRQRKQINEYKQLYFLQQSDYKIDPDRSLLEQCNDLPYDPDWEFPEERLILGNILGAGAFGQVVQAEAIGILALNPRDKSAESFKRRSKIRRSSKAKELKKEEGSGGWKNVKIPVAVKTLKEGATKEEYKDLASELKILIHLGQHKNIVNLLGACTRGKRLMVIMEFAPHGSLLSFLREKREVYDASWTKTMSDPEKEFTLVDLVMISFQVARGMSFLASRKCVHRDLAARNILVGEDYVMKIADFGLARDIYKDDLYVKKTQGLLPVKWMAPESLFDRVYTEKTDVWSFGILLWEAFTLGGTPYPGLPTEQLLDYLSEGKRMDMPSKCPVEVYTIMRDCWIHEADQRPRFTTLTERLAHILEKNTSKENPYLALQMEEEAKPNQGYYMQPIDDAGLRESKRYVISPVHSPTSDTSEPPNFAEATADSVGYNSPLPTLPPSQTSMSDEDIPNDSLPPLPPPNKNTGRRNSAGGESGIDMDGADDGYIDDARVDSPFLPPPGNKPVAIELNKVNMVPKAKVLSKGRSEKYETEL